MARSSSCLICECIRTRWVIFGGACHCCIVDDDMWNVSECTAQWGCENDLWINKEWMSVSMADISILRLLALSDFKYQVSSNARTSNEIPMVEEKKSWKLETCLPRSLLFCYRSARTIRTTTWFTAAALKMNYRHRWFIAAPRVWVQRARYRTFAKSLSKTLKQKSVFSSRKHKLSTPKPLKTCSTQQRQWPRRTWQLLFSKFFLKKFFNFSLESRCNWWWGRIALI